MNDYLIKNKLIQGVILLIYYLLVVLPHQEVGKLTVSLFGKLSRSHYNLLIAISSILVALIMCWLLIGKLKSNPMASLWLKYLIINILLMVLCFYFLFVINIEVVHIIQYAVFAILCFPLFRNTISSMTLSVVAGAADELYQYLVLTPLKNNYYDFNDVIINMIGAATGLLILRIYGARVMGFNFKAWYRSFDFIFLFSLSIFIVMLYSMGYVTYFQSDNPEAIFSLIKVPETTFWTFPPGPPARFHVVRPLEALMIILILWILYLPLNFGSDKSKSADGNKG